MDADRSFGLSQPVASPLYTSAVYSIPDLDVLDRICDGKEPGYIYARDKHPNAQQLADELAKLESAEWGVMTASGMGAVSATLMAIVSQGDRIIASDQLYGRTTQLLTTELFRLGVSVSIVDMSNLDHVEVALAQPAKALIIETISNPMLRVADVPALGQLAEKHNCELILDNTFATPVLFRPIEVGATIVIESLTKMIGGHSDITLGGVFGRNPDLQKRISQVMTIWGLSPSPFDCWMAMRSLATMELRVRTAAENAAKLANWLPTQSGVRKVYYPGLPSHPDHGLAKRLMSGPPGNIITVELEGGREAVNGFMRTAIDIPFCPSLGDAQTTCSYPAGTSHRYVDLEEKRRLGITDGLLRLSIGIEPIDVIRQNLVKGLS